jgi:hypothetical protein
MLYCIILYYCIHSSTLNNFIFHTSNIASYTIIYYCLYQLSSGEFSKFDPENLTHLDSGFTIIFQPPMTARVKLLIFLEVGFKAYVVFFFV